MSWIKDDSGMCAVEVTLIDWDSLRIILFYTQQEQVLAWHSTVLHCSLGNGGLYMQCTLVVLYLQMYMVCGVMGGNVGQHM